MKSGVLVFSIALLLASPFASAQVDAPRITQEEFKKLFASKKVVIVDTRNVDAFAISHIPGALLLPLEGLMTWPAEYEKVAQTIQKSNKPIVTYCA
jgi:rhodanese-related sulfurtransferase